MVLLLDSELTGANFAKNRIDTKTVDQTNTQTHEQQ
jgi:hypothetical protein